MDRKEIAEVIRRSLFENRRELAAQFDSAREKIGYFVLDDLLPDEWVAEIYKAFPNERDMVYKRTLSEHKYIGVQMSRYHSLLEETLYAFQQAPVVELIREICGLSDVRPDELLYAGGISTMGYGGYLQPHLDNSHNWNRELWRVLNVLYYVSPDWNFSQGGNLELWPKGLREPPLTIESKCNRLVVLTTHGRSWHSVSPIRCRIRRCCISNYYFSPQSPVPGDKFHVTSFRGRPGQRVRNFILSASAGLRMGVRGVFKLGIRKPTHIYRGKT